MLSGQVMPVTKCATWCADQAFHANTESIILIVIAAVVLAAYMMINTIYPRLQNPTIKEETMETIMLILVRIAAFLLLIFLYYHFFMYEPRYHAEVTNSFIDTGVFINQTLNNSLGGI